MKRREVKTLFAEAPLQLLLPKIYFNKYFLISIQIVLKSIFKSVYISHPMRLFIYLKSISMKAVEMMLKVGVLLVKTLSKSLLLLFFDRSQ